MSELLSRREALKVVVLLIGAVEAVRAASDSKVGTSMLMPLKASDADAIARGYHEDASTVDSKEFPTYQPGQICANCLQMHGDRGDALHYCNLFRGKLVAANGWCKAWARKQ